MKRKIFNLLILFLIVVGLSGCIDGSLSNTLDQVVNSASDSLGASSSIVSTDLIILSEDDMGNTNYRAEAVVDGNPNWVEFVSLGIRPQSNPYGFDRIFAGQHDMVPADGIYFSDFSVQKNEYTRYFFILVKKDGSRVLSEYQEIIPQSLAEDARLEISDIAEEIVISQDQPFEFEVDSSEGFRSVVVYIDTMDQTMKYFGYNYWPISFWEGTPVDGSPSKTAFAVGMGDLRNIRSGRQLSVDINEIKMQIFVVDNANNVLVTDWFYVKLE